jgi:Protein of unknown function (DUF3500)
MRLFVILGVVLVTALAATFLTVPGPPPAASQTASTATARIVAAARDFLDTLDGPGREAVQFPADSPQRTNWSNLPTGIFVRSGLRVGDLNQTQRAALMALLAAAFSPDGYRKVMDIVQGDQTLATEGGGRGGRGRGGRGGPTFGEAEYYVAFVGEPSGTDRWTLQFGGHHLAVNLTLAGSRATLAPSHTGAQPTNFTFEGRTVRPLGDEVDLAFALMGSLDGSQQSEAILGSRVADLVLGPGQDGRTIQPEGLRASELSADQRETLVDLIAEWAGIANDAFAGPRMSEIRSNLDATWFAWSGPTTPGSAAYFRVQGPTLVIEYAPQGGTDHIHTIYRDPTNDYGAAY